MAQDQNSRIRGAAPVALLDRMTAIKLGAAGILFLAILLMPAPEGLTTEGQRALAVDAAGGGTVGHPGAAHRGTRHRRGRPAGGIGSRAGRRSGLIRVLTAGRLLPHRHTDSGACGSALRSGGTPGHISDLGRGRQASLSLCPDAVFLRRPHLRAAFGQHQRRHHGTRLRAGAGPLERAPGTPVLQDHDAGPWQSESPRFHGVAGGRTNAGGGVGPAGRLLLDAMVRPDEPALLCQPDSGAEPSCTCFTGTVSNWETSRMRGGRPPGR